MTIFFNVYKVMSGTGDLEVFRYVRHLGRRKSLGEVTYGNHMAIHMALGFLFLGGCQYSLENTNKAVAVLLTAVYPTFPLESSDNR